MICDKVFECTEHSADRRSTYLLQEFSWEVFNHHPSYSSDLIPSDFHLFLHLKKFLSDQQERIQNDREDEMNVTMVPIQAEDFYDTSTHDTKVDRTV